MARTGVEPGSSAYNDHISAIWIYGHMTIFRPYGYMASNGLYECRWKQSLGIRISSEAEPRYYNIENNSSKISYEHLLHLIYTHFPLKVCDGEKREDKL